MVNHCLILLMLRIVVIMDLYLEIMLTYGGFIKIIRDIKDTGVAGWTCQERDEHSLLRWLPSIPLFPKERSPRLLFHASYTKVVATSCNRFGGNSTSLLKNSCNPRSIFSIDRDRYFWLKVTTFLYFLLSSCHDCNSLSQLGQPKDQRSSWLPDNSGKMLWL